MLRAGKKAASVKPNRKLDKRASRGMIYENEELRLRTMNINAEVERGQSDNRKMRRENDRLRRELWALREHVDEMSSRRRRPDVLDRDDDDDDDEEREETSYETEDEQNRVDGGRPSVENLENLHKDFGGLNSLREETDEALAAAASSGQPIPPPERTVQIVLPEEASLREESPEPLPYPFPSTSRVVPTCDVATTSDETTTSGFSGCWDPARISGVISRDSSGSSSLGLGCERFETVVRRRSSPGPQAMGFQQRRSSVRSDNGINDHSCQRCAVNSSPRRNSCVMLGASEPALHIWRGSEMVPEASGALSVFSARDEHLRLHCVEPYTLIFHLSHLPSALSDLVATEVIDELHRQLGTLTEVTGVRVASGVCYISLASAGCLRTLVECGLCIRGVSVPLLDASVPSAVFLALGGVPPHLNDTAISNLMAPLGVIDGPVEHRVYRGVDTGERLLRLKPTTATGGLDHLHLPSYINLNGHRLLLRLVSPEEVPRSFDTFWRPPTLVHEAVQTEPSEDPQQQEGIKIGKSFGLRHMVNVNLQVPPTGTTPVASPVRTEPPRLHHTLSAMPLMGNSRECPPGHAPLQRAVSASHHQLSPTTPAPPVVPTTTVPTSPNSASTPRTSVNFDARLPGRQGPQPSRSASPVVNGILRKHTGGGGSDVEADRPRPRSRVLSRSFSLDPARVLGVGLDKNKKTASRVDSSSTTTPSTPVEDPDGIHPDRVSMASRGSGGRRQCQKHKDVPPTLPWCGCFGGTYV